MMEYRDRGKIWLVDAAIGTETGKFKGGMYVRSGSWNPKLFWLSCHVD